MNDTNKLHFANQLEVMTLTYLLKRNRQMIIVFQYVMQARLCKSTLLHIQDKCVHTAYMHLKESIYH